MSLGYYHFLSSSLLLSPNMPPSPSPFFLQVSVFETNIRVVGGLLSAHLLLQRSGGGNDGNHGSDIPEGWPCAGPLLDMAVDVASRLLPAFATPTG